MKSIFLLIVMLIAIVPGGCTFDTKKVNSVPKYYFDLKSYFEGEARRLDSTNLMVKKSVSKNSDIEKKEIKVKDWAIELALFTSSDINKTAWKESYTKDSSATRIVYRAKFPDLKTQMIEITMTDQKPSFIKIINQQKNYLYKNSEELMYWPDSLYQIRKEQQLLFWDKQVYDIEGEIIKREQ